MLCPADRLPSDSGPKLIALMVHRRRCPGSRAPKLSKVTVVTSQLVGNREIESCFRSYKRRK